ncbi:MAG: aldehyde dehydrogenase family protein [Methanoregulaceae archaeon]|nr:aldehyde dehydrogenase family protein [Methanoregulaceae archaeon]
MFGLHREMLIDGHFVGGPCDQAVGKLVVRNPYDGQVIGTAAEGGWSEANTALAAAQDAFQRQDFPSEARRALLIRIADLVEERAEELAEVLVYEIGKPITWARGEVTRTAVTFRLAADAVELMRPEPVELPYDARAKDYEAHVARFPIGVVLAIVPYNWPYNLTAHKIAPALAAGNTVVVKPSSLAPLSTLSLIRLIHEAGCPPGWVNAVVVPSAIAQKMALDSRVAKISFTGSPAVGWMLKEKLPYKRVTLELGGDAAAIVAEDADLDWAIPRIAAGAYGYAGQVCISVQHVWADRSRYDEVKSRLIEATKDCPTGDPRDERMVCGPLISSTEAERVMHWIAEACSQGATLLAGGGRSGNIVEPTLLENVPNASKLGCEEVFGPVLTLRPYNDIAEPIAHINASPFGIHTGVFTQNDLLARRAFQELDVGGVVIDDFPTLRFDVLPYGGVRKSGFGREGVRYALEEMTELRSLVRRRPS